LFTLVDLEARVRRDHPLRAIRRFADEAAGGAEPRVLGALRGEMGRPSIAPEMLLRAMLLQAFYSIRSERQLMERLEFDLLFRWFVGLGSTIRPGITRPSRRTGTGCWRRDRGEVPGGGAGAAAGEAAAVERSLQRRRHADRGLGVDEELQAKDAGDDGPHPRRS